MISGTVWGTHSTYILTDEVWFISPAEGLWSCATQERSRRRFTAWAGTMAAILECFEGVWRVRY